MKTYAVIYDDDIRMESSSGGVFSRFAHCFDVVYGVSMSDDCYFAKMTRAENNISPLRGAKYIQARMGDAFKLVKEDLLNEKKVLFTGTGCQINGLKRFLGSDFDNLLCIDVVCHGVPSPLLWKKYVEWIENKNGKLASVQFRCKYRGIDNFKVKNNQMLVTKDDDLYMRFFLSDISLRPSCYKCQAKNCKLSDVSIADFWGIENVEPSMDDGKGTSLVITRSDKGQMFFDTICCDLKWKEVNYEDGVRCNPSEFRSVTLPLSRTDFYVDLYNLSLDKLEKKYLQPSFTRRIKQMIRKIIVGGHKNTMSLNCDYGVLYTFEKNEANTSFIQ